MSFVNNFLGQCFKICHDLSVLYQFKIKTPNQNLRIKRKMQTEMSKTWKIICDGQRNVIWELIKFFVAHHLSTVMAVRLPLKRGKFFVSFTTDRF